MRIVVAFTLAAALCACKRQVDAAFKTEPVSKGSLSETVAATGEVSAVVTVTVGSQISGAISRLYVDFNSPVKRGQMLAEIDPRLFEVAQARAVAGLLAADAEVEKAKVTLDDARRVEQRLAELFHKGLVSGAEADTAASNRAGAAAALRAAEARVAQARADRDAAVTNVALCRIRSPIDGIVISRNVDVGQTVAASLQSPTLFVIANDLSRMQVLANVDEADVGKVKEGMLAQFTVDAFPGEVFKGRIREVRQAPASIQNVVTYAAVLDAPNPERKLRQGMTASISVVTSQRSDALRIPNAALRYRPAGDGSADKPAVAAAAVAAGARADTKRPPAKQDAGGEPVRPGIRKVIAYRLEGAKPVRVALLVGISDGHRTEVVSGLAEGDQVVLGDAAGSSGRRGNRGPL
jgi:HlyD family secretion protein